MPLDQPEHIIQALSAYIPMDRRQALAHRQTLPEQAEGSALFADISGFTPLAEALVSQLGPQRGAEELTFHLNQIYNALIAQVYTYSGSIIGFVGDAITCWFEQDDGLRAVASAVAMQAAIKPFAHIEVSPGVVAAFTIKIGLANGPARRFCVGDPNIQWIDTLAGNTLRLMSMAEGLAQKGEILLDAATATTLADRRYLELAEWRTHPDTSQRFAVLSQLTHPITPQPWPILPDGTLNEADVRPWVLPPVYECIRTGRGQFLAELRPAVSLFLKFTGIDYDHDPQAGDKLDAYIAWVQQVVTRHGGSLIQLTIGDKGSFVYVAFGAPLAHDDDTRRAVEAALALQTPPDPLNFVTAQIGLAHGQARTGDYGGSMRRSYGVIGNDAVLAARLMGVASPGQIYCAYSIYRYTNRWVTFENLPPVRVKGRAGKVQVYRPIRQSQDSPHSAPIRQAAMVGRQAELARLEAALDALQAGQPAVLIIEGEAGIGKSRLLQELMRLVQARGLAVLMGAGHSLEQQAPYRAWRGVFSSYFDSDRIPDRAQRRQRVQSLLQQLAPDQTLRWPLLNDVLDLGWPDNDLTAALDPNLRQQNLALLLTALLQTWSREQPLIVILEDAHWLDSLSWQLAEYVARALSVAAVPFLLVLLQRPLEEKSLASPSIARLRALPISQGIALTALSQAEIAHLTAHYLERPVYTVPSVLIELVQAKAGGNPFFAEELLVSLQEQGLIETMLSSDPHHLNMEQIRQTLPDTLHGLILSRIDRLPPQHQFTLKVAAVIGQVFEYAALYHTLNQYMPVSDQTLRDQLRALDAAHFTYLERSQPDIIYMFKHMITQEAAYQTLLFSQRRQLHHTIAAWYELRLQNVQAGVLLPVLVHHYRYAEDTAKERLYANLAGEHTAAQFANDEAVRYFSRALELTPAPNAGARYELLLKRENVYKVQSKRAAQNEDLEALASLAGQLADRQKQAEVAIRQAVYADAVSDHPAAVAAAQAVIAYAVEADDSSRQASGHLVLGMTLMRQGNHAQARPHLTQALSLFQQAGNRQGEGDTLKGLGVLYEEQADVEQAAHYFEQAMTIRRELSDLLGEGGALGNLASIALMQADYERAQVYYERALHIEIRIGHRLGEGMMRLNLGSLFQMQGDYARARYYYDQALPISREVGNQSVEWAILANLGFLLHAVGDDENAHTYSQQAMALAQAMGRPHCQSYALLARGHAHLGLGDAAGAAEDYRQMQTLALSINMPTLLVSALAGLAHTAWQQGQQQPAQALVQDILAHLENNPDLTGSEEPFQVFLVCYRVLCAGGDPRAEDLLQHAYHLLQARAARINDEATRRMFLHNVPEHQGILAAWQSQPASSGACEPPESHPIRENRQDSPNQEIEDMNPMDIQTQHLIKILEISRELIAATSLEHILHQIVMAVAELTDSQEAAILLRDEHSGELRFVATSMLPHQMANIPVPVEGSIAGDVLSSGTPLIVADARSDPRHYKAVDQITGLETRSLLAVPLQFKIHRIGVLEAINKCGSKSFTQQDQNTLEAMAAHATVAIENARTLKALRSAYDRLEEQMQDRQRLLEVEQAQRRLAEALRQAGAALNGTLKYDEVIDRILEQLSQVVPNDAANVMLIEKDGTARVFRGRGYEQVGTASTLRSTTLNVADVVGLRHMQQTRLPLAIPDVKHAEGWVYSRPEHTWIRSYAGAPILIRDYVIGFLNVISATPDFYTQADAERLQTFAHHAAIAIENARLYHRLEQELLERTRAEQEVRRHRDHLEEIVDERTTDLRRAMAQAMQLNHQLQDEIAERERLIDDLKAFSHTVAHDLKNPLGLVIGYSQLLVDSLKERNEATLLELADPINHTGYHMTRIIDELLTLASVREQNVAPRRLNMTAITAEAEKRLAYTISQAKAELVKPEHWPAALGHAPWVEEVWANYISNAIKYGGSPPRIVLGADPWPTTATPAASEEGAEQPVPPRPAIRFWVRDNGQGLSQPAQTELFKRFARFDEARATGHGLGLSIVKRIVEKLGGQVGVESQPGQGCTFFFTLPAASQDEDVNIA